VGRDEFLREDSVAPEPWAIADRLEGSCELVPVAAADDVSPPAAETRLENERWLDSQWFLVRWHVDRARVPDAGGRRRRAVRSLSCTPSSANAVFSTRTPRRSMSSSASSPSSTPSSVGSTSSRASASSPGSMKVSAAAADTRRASMPRARQAATSSTFVSFAVEPITATAGTSATASLARLRWCVPWRSVRITTSTSLGRLPSRSRPRR
jgi:hypothetical protein